MEIPTDSRLVFLKRALRSGESSHRSLSPLQNRLQAFVILLSTILMSSSAAAEIRFVASGRLGASFTNDLTFQINPNTLVGGINPLLPSVGNAVSQSQPGYSIGGSLGAQFGNWIRWDVFDLGYSLNTQDFSFSADTAGVGDFQMNGSMIVYGTGIRLGRFSPEARWRPFVSLGVGAANAQLSTATQDLYPFFTGPLLRVESFKGWGFEWDVGFGLEYGFASRGAAALRFRYRQSDVSFGKTGEAQDAIFEYVDAFPGQTKQIRVFSLAFELSFIGP